MPAKLRPVTDTEYPEWVDRLIAAARAVRMRACAPYSNFLVGAAVLEAAGRIHVGTNVEAVDYDGTHAEESALSVMVAAEPIVPLTYPVMIVAVGAEETVLQGSASIVSPCGKCRQKIYEWTRATPYDIDVIVTDPRTKEPRLCSIRELLPLSFGF